MTDKKNLKQGIFKYLRRLVVFTMVNIIIALAYCYFTKHMTILSFSNVLTIIGVAYIILAGAPYLGGMLGNSSYSVNFTQNSNMSQYHRDNSSRFKFMLAVLSYGFPTLLLAYLLLLAA